MKKIFCVILFSLMTATGAETIPLPSSVPGADELVAEFRNQMMTKMVDLGKNYISTIHGNTLVFTNSEEMKCNDVKAEAGDRLASIQYSHSLRGKELIEQVSYTGCNAQISLIEDTITVGENLTPMNFKDVMKGKRPIELSPSESKRRFKVSNGEGDELFNVLLEKNENAQYVSFSILGQRFLEVNYRYSSEATRAILTFYGYEALYVRNHGRWGINNKMDSFNITVVAKKDGTISYFNNGGNLISLNGFNNYKSVMDSTIHTLEDIFAYHTYYFPKTESTKSGNQAQRLIDELRLAQNRLLANTDMALVKKLIQDLISSAELGQIIDNRPKQK